MLNEKEVNRLLIDVANKITSLEKKIEEYKNMANKYQGDNEIKKMLDEFEAEHSQYNSIFDKLADLKMSIRLKDSN